MVTHGIPHHKVVMVLHASITSENEVSIAILCLLVHPVTQQHESEKYVCIKVATMKSTDSAARPIYCLKLKYPFPFSVNYAQLITQQYESRTV